jgi:hypothetical protein
MSPRLHGLVYENDTTFWTENMSKFRTQYQTRTKIAQMDRILPLPKLTREALISYFYPRQPLNSEIQRHCRVF